MIDPQFADVNPELLKRYPKLFRPKNPPTIARGRIGSTSAMSGYHVGFEVKPSPKRMPITTCGALGDSDEAYVYVGLARNGKVKVGMSCNPQRRCNKDLHIELMFVIQVTKSAAKEVETVTLRRLGHLVGDGEWAKCDVEVAITAAKDAFTEVCGYMHADPALTAEQARVHRVAKAQHP